LWFRTFSLWDGGGGGQLQFCSLEGRREGRTHDTLEIRKKRPEYMPLHYPLKGKTRGHERSTKKGDLIAGEAEKGK